VDDAARVRVGHRLAGLLENREEAAAVVRRILALLKQRGERAPLDELHREERPAVRLQAEAVDRNDSGVLELRANLRLLDESLEHLRLVRLLLAQQLQGDVAAQVLVARLVDDADAAARDLAHDVVAAVVLGAVVGGRQRGHAQQRRLLIGQVVQQDARARAGEPLDGLEHALDVIAAEERLEPPVPTLLVPAPLLVVQSSLRP
jgi:hypothetical protein